MIPVLVEPKFDAFKNRWRKNLTLSGQLGRDLVITIFSGLVVFGIYNGCLALVRHIERSSSIVQISPSLPLGLLLLLLLIMLLFSNCIHALGAMFLSKDLDLVLSSPIGPAQFFYGKFIDTFLSSSWMALIFGTPAIVAFGVAYHVDPVFYFLAAIILLPYFALPVSLSILTVTIFARVIPIHRTREIILGVAILAVIALYFITRAINPGDTSYTDLTDILHIVSLASIPHTIWSPSYWTAVSISELLEGRGTDFIPYVVMLYATFIAATSLAYILFRLFYQDAYSAAHNTKSTFRLESKRSQQRLILLTPFLSRPFRAVLAKEYKLFARDMTQTIQLMLLIGLCVIYLYNFRILNGTSAISESARVWWQGFLVIANIAMGGFVITAVCTRFVYPSVSSEGRSYWILQTSPLSTHDLLRAKFWCWLVPIATISSFIFSSGAFAIDAAPHIIVLNALASWIMCYGIVGLAVGLGAVFATFNWEHTSQLSASFGALVFMLSSAIIIFVNMIPAALLIFLRTLRETGHNFPAFDWYLSVTICALLLAVINYKTTDWAIKMGENSLNTLKQGK
ncbi:MAG: hypothetical protein D6719_01785 [Candidatus Dadabacteria bacterium]|nr:MAG: hypothetical protein D6719_01785 [Candidatus Dadabacteria bacterium]